MSMNWPPVRPRPAAGVTPNLEDYDRACASFSWSNVRDELGWNTSGNGFNIAGAIDRHAAGGLRDQIALRWLGKGGASTISLSELGRCHRHEDLLDWR